MLNSPVAILTYILHFESTLQMIFVGNLIDQNVFYICYLAYILQWLTPPQRFIQQSPEIRFCAASNLT